MWFLHIVRAIFISHSFNLKFGMRLSVSIVELTALYRALNDNRGSGRWHVGRSTSAIHIVEFLLGQFFGGLLRRCWLCWLRIFNNFGTFFIRHWFPLKLVSLTVPSLVVGDSWGTRSGRKHMGLRAAAAHVIQFLLRKF